MNISCLECLLYSRLDLPSTVSCKGIAHAIRLTLDAQLLDAHLQARSHWSLDLARSSTIRRYGAMQLFRNKGGSVLHSGYIGNGEIKINLYQGRAVPGFKRSSLWRHSQVADTLFMTVQCQIMDFISLQEVKEMSWKSMILPGPGMRWKIHVNARNSVKCMHCSSWYFIKWAGVCGLDDTMH